MDGVQLPQGLSHFEEAVYFLPNFANVTWCQKWATNESRQQYQLLKLLSSSPIIKLHYLQINKNRLTDGQIQSTRPSSL